MIKILNLPMQVLPSCCTLFHCISTPRQPPHLHQVRLQHGIILSQSPPHPAHGNLFLLMILALARFCVFRISSEVGWQTSYDFSSPAFFIFKLQVYRLKTAPLLRRLLQTFCRFLKRPGRFSFRSHRLHPAAIPPFAILCVPPAIYSNFATQPFLNSWVRISTQTQTRVL